MEEEKTKSPDPKVSEGEAGKGQMEREVGEASKGSASTTQSQGATEHVTAAGSIVEAVEMESTEPAAEVVQNGGSAEKEAEDVESTVVTTAESGRISARSQEIVESGERGVCGEATALSIEGGVITNPSGADGTKEPEKGGTEKMGDETERSTASDQANMRVAAGVLNFVVSEVEAGENEKEAESAEMGEQHDDGGPRSTVEDSETSAAEENDENIAVSPSPSFSPMSEAPPDMDAEKSQESDVTEIGPSQPISSEAVPSTSRAVRAASPDIATRRTPAKKRGAKKKAAPRRSARKKPSAPTTPTNPPPSDSENELIIDTSDASDNDAMDGTGTNQANEASQMQVVAYNENAAAVNSTVAKKEKRKQALDKNEVYGEFRCEYAGCESRIFLSCTKLQKHYRYSHDGPFNCAGCKKNAPNSNCLRVHVNKCPVLKGLPEKKLSCITGDRKCKSFSTDRWQEMVAHLTKQHEGQTFEEYTQMPPEFCVQPPPSERRKPIPSKRDVKAGRYGVVKAKEDENAVRPIVHKEPSGTAKQENLHTFPVLMKEDKVEIIQETDKTKFNYPGFVRIELHEGGILRHFPAFISFMMQSELQERGGVVIKPPSNFRPHRNQAALLEKLKKTFIRASDYVKATKQVGEPPAFEFGYTTRHYDPKAFSIYQLYETRTDGTDARLPLETRESRLMEKLRNEEKLEGYVQNLSGSLFDVNLNFWNLRQLQNDLTDPQVFGKKEANKAHLILPPIDGINRPQLYIGRRNTIIPLHKEDFNFGSVLYNHMGAPKILYVVGPKYADELQERMGMLFKEETEVCSAFLRHKMHYASPELLDAWKIPYNKLVINEGEFAVLAPNALHEGFNIGFNVVESVNYHCFECVDYFLDDSYTCFCRNYPLILAKGGVVAKYNRDGISAYLAGKMEWTRPNDQTKSYIVPNQKMLMETYVAKHNEIVAKYRKEMIKFDNMAPKQLKVKDLEDHLMILECLKVPIILRITRLTPSEHPTRRSQRKRKAAEPIKEKQGEKRAKRAEPQESGKEDLEVEDDENGESEETSKVQGSEEESVSVRVVKRQGAWVVSPSTSSELVEASSQESVSTKELDGLEREEETGIDEEGEKSESSGEDEEEADVKRNGKGKVRRKAKGKEMAESEEKAEGEGKVASEDETKEKKSGKAKRKTLSSRGGVGAAKVSGSEKGKRGGRKRK